MFHILVLLFLCSIPNINSKCIWYGGIRDSYNEVYLNGEPKPLPSNDTYLLNEMCPHIATQNGEFCFIFKYIFLF
jgi:hypothetical protein